MDQEIADPPRPAFFSGEKVRRVLLVALCLAWLLPGLVGHEPWKSDEAHSFGLVHDLLRGGSRVAPALAGEPFTAHPPLYHLTAAAFAQALATALPPHDAARLATGFYMALALLLAGLAGREAWGKGRGWLTLFVLIGCLGLLLRGHEMIADSALFAFAALGMYGLMLIPRRPLLGGLYVGLGAGLGFLSRGWLAPLLLGATFLLLPLLFAPWRNRKTLSALGVAMLAALPWLVGWMWLLYQKSPALFNEWLRDGGVRLRWSSREPAYYLEILPWFAWPALPIALWTLWRERRTALTQPPIQISLVLFAVMLLTLTLTTEARDLHALPLLLPLSLLAAAGVDTLRRGAASALNWFGIMTFGFFSGVFWFFWVAMMTGHPERNAQHLLKLQPGYAPVFSPGAFAFALLLTGLWLVVVALSRRAQRNRRAILNWAAGITLMWGLLMTLWLPWLDAGKSYRSLFLSLRQALPASGGCLASRHLGESQRAMLHYYAGIIPRRNGKQACRLLLVQGNARETPNAPGDEWRKIWEGARPGDKLERYRLYERKD